MEQWLDRLRQPLVTLALIAALIVSGWLAFAARQGTDTPVIQNSLQGKLLVAKPSMGDPRFRKTVILMVRHDETGAFGLVVNRPLGRVEISENDKAEDKKDKPDGGTAEKSAKTAKVRLRAFAGGPVAPRKAFVIHSPDYRIDATVRVNAEVSVTGDRRIMQDIMAGAGPKKVLYIMGYSGWGAGQIENEMRRNDWYTAPVDARLIFGEQDAEAVWEKAVKAQLRGI
jgi:putative transcriptional regulator